jgi:hypothetical protein
MNTAAAAKIFYSLLIKNDGEIRSTLEEANNRFDINGAGSDSAAWWKALDLYNDNF